MTAVATATAARPASLWDRLPCMALRLAPDGSVIEMNAECRAFMAAGTAPPPDGEAWLQSLAPSSRVHLLHALAARHDTQLPLQISRPAGTWVDIRLRWEPAALAAPGGSCLGVLTDTSAQHLAEQQSRDAEARLGKFMQASSDGIVFHREGRVVDANPPICELLGCTLAELKQRPLIELVAPDQVARVKAVMKDGGDTPTRLRSSVAAASASRSNASSARCGTAASRPAWCWCATCATARPRGRASANSPTTTR